MEDPSGNNPPWCFYPAGEDGGPEVCEAINFIGDSGPGLAQADFDNMKERYKSQLNIDGTGAVVASPDTETPGGAAQAFCRVAAQESRGQRRWTAPPASP